MVFEKRRLKAQEWEPAWERVYPAHPMAAMVSKVLFKDWVFTRRPYVVPAQYFLLASRGDNPAAPLVTRWKREFFALDKSGRDRADIRRGVASRYGLEDASSVFPPPPFIERFLERHRVEGTSIDEYWADEITLGAEAAKQAYRDN